MSEKGRIFLLFSCTFLIYFFCGAGYIDTVDADPSVETARALLHEGSLTFIPKRYVKLVLNASPGKQGYYFSRMGLMMPILYLAPVGVGDLLEGFRGLSANRWGLILVSTVNQAITSLVLVLLYLFLIKQNLKAKDALLWTLIAGFSTLLFPYSKTCHREPVLALFTLGAFGFANEKKWMAAGFCLALGFLTKEAWIISMIPLLIFVFLTQEEKVIRRKFFCPLIFTLLFFQIYRFMLQGSLLRVTYAPLAVMNPFGRMWSTPFWEGVLQQWLSPSNGLLVLNPVLLVSIYLFVIKVLKKNLEKIEVAAFATVCLTTAFYARWFSPMGGTALGPRYLVSVIPLFFLFLPPQPKFRFNLWVVLPLIFISFCIQIINVSVRPLQYWVLLDLLKMPASTSQLRVNAVLFKRKFMGEKEHFEVGDFEGAAKREGSLEDHPSFTGWNFWWVHMKKDELRGRLGYKERNAVFSLRHSDIH